MTIGTLVFMIFGIIVALGGLLFAIKAYKDGNRGAGLGAAAIGIMAGLMIIGGCLFYANTEEGKRAYKDQQSNLNGGISRTVTVYDIDGDIIAKYSGKFDIETDNSSYILFDDENSKRHIVYYSTATIIIDEN